MDRILTTDSVRAHEKSAQAGDETIRGTQVGRTLSTTIEDLQLMPEQCGRRRRNGVRPALPVGPG